ncbi:MAG: patatin-like phospholipase family protein [Saprospiraceae bacterium]|uniref:Patatin-like phospholipase family protein n=1 Tax=Candidatus Opimibacter skivensis TaxID=2982028 RepID=A0A9D7SQE3_9BACT|nr:patatin-like phospholipase family protein [Candidatus Opimibacter skivensis]
MHKIGIALSGGGTRGVVHIGVLQALEENGIFPTIISGCSAGSIVGSMYAQGYTPSEIMTIASERSLLWMFSLRLPTKGFVRHNFLRKMLKRYIPINTFEELKKPLYVAVSNLNSGKPEIKSTGPLHDVIVASCSIPILFEPILMDNNWYVDGGLLMNLPVSPIRDKASYIIAVNLIPRKELLSEKVNTISGVAARTFNLAAINTIEPELKYCDLLIEPLDLYHYSRFNFTNIKEMYEIGYNEAMRMMPLLKEELKAMNEVASGHNIN